MKEVIKIKKYSTQIRLKQLMQEQNLRQVDILNLAKPYCDLYDVKLNKSDLSQYLAGKTEPNQDKLAILGMSLNVNESWLMGFDVPKERNCQPSLSSKSNLSDPIEEKYGKSVADAIQLYLQLDSDDQGEIRGEMKHMLKAEKYSVQEELKNA